MAKHIHTTYYEDNYVRYKCYECGKSFIVGEELSKGCSLSCPYCGSKSIDCEAKTDDESIEDLDMGCIGIYFDKLDLLAVEIAKRVQNIYKVEEIKFGLELLASAVDSFQNSFQDSIKKLSEILNPTVLELEKLVVDKQIKVSKLNKIYPSYKSKFHSKRYYNKRIYHNCRNNC